MTTIANWNPNSAKPIAVIRSTSRVVFIDWGDHVPERIELSSTLDNDGFYSGTSSAYDYARDDFYQVRLWEDRLGGPVAFIMRAVIMSSEQVGGDLTGGGGRPDWTSAGSGDDTIAGGFFGDVLRGNGGDDVIGGGPRFSADDADTLYGGSGNDRLSGGADADRLFGGTGDDRLEGDNGVDRLVGGTGADTFVFVRAVDSTGHLLAKDTDRDTVVDFEQGVDKLDVGNWSHSFTVIGDTAFTHSGAAELRIIHNSAGTIVIGDTNGDGTADISFRLLGQHTLTAADFTF